jgi:hypothetical protein
MRRTLTMLSAMAVMVVLASGVALAVNQVTCPGLVDPSDPDSGGALCEGTTKADQITGSPYSETIYAYAGNDIVDGQAGDDFIFGDRGSDKLTGGEGSDYVVGGDGNDTIDLTDSTGSTDGSEEIAFGFSGNDTIYAADGNADTIQCGAGKSDSVTYDQFDTVNDETLNPADCEKLNEVFVTSTN